MFTKRLNKRVSTDLVLDVAAEVELTQGIVVIIDAFELHFVYLVILANLSSLYPFSFFFNCISVVVWHFFGLTDYSFMHFLIELTCIVLLSEKNKRNT